MMKDEVILKIKDISGDILEIEIEDGELLIKAEDKVENNTVILLFDVEELKLIRDALTYGISKLGGIIMEILKVTETVDKFEFQFEDVEDATEFRDLLRDAGFSATMDAKKQDGNWNLIVEKDSILYAFFREFILLRSPKKYVDLREEVKEGITGGWHSSS